MRKPQVGMPTMSRRGWPSEGWFYQQTGETCGPVSTEQLKELLPVGLLQPRQAASIPAIAPLFPTPERAEGAVLALGKVLTLLVRAAQVALGHSHLLDAVLEEEVLQLLLHLRVGHYVGCHRAPQIRPLLSAPKLGRGVGVHCHLCGVATPLPSSF